MQSSHDKARRVYTYMNRRLRKQHIPAAIIFDSGEPLLGDEEMVDIFAGYFAVCYIDPVIGDDVIYMTTPTDSSMIENMMHHVKTSLRSLDVHRAPEWNEFHPLVIKKLAPITADPINKGSQLSICSGEITHDWKMGVVEPFHKIGDETHQKLLINLPYSNTSGSWKTDRNMYT